MEILKISTVDDVSFWETNFRERHPDFGRKIDSVRYIFKFEGDNLALFTIKDITKNLDKIIRSKFGDKLLNFTNYKILDNLIILQDNFIFQDFFIQIINNFETNKIILCDCLSYQEIQKCFNFCSNIESRHLENVYLFSFKSNECILQSHKIINKIEPVIKEDLIFEKRDLSDYVFDRTIFNENDLELFVDRYETQYKDFEIFPEYLAGIIDGDGSIFCSSNYPYYCKVSISQCDFLLIFILYKRFGGNIRKIVKDGEKRNQYELSFFHKECKEILEFIVDKLFLKKTQARTALENISILRHASNENILSEHSKTISNLNKNHQSTIIEGEMNNKYVAGLFDSEGSYLDTELTITQRNSPSLLQNIIDFLGYGKIKRNDFFYISSKQNIYNFFERINKYLIVKKQCQLTIDYLNKKRVKFDPSCDPYRRKIHHNFDIPIDFIKNISYEKPSKTYQDNITLRNELSQKKIGIKNPNFNKELSQEHCDKISRSTFGKHRAISDETIHQILLLKDSLSQIKICEKLHVERHHVSDVISGKLLPTDSATLVEDLAKLKEKKTQQSLLKEKLEEKGIMVNSGVAGGISKRSIDGKYMANIWYFGKLRVDRKTNLVPLPFTNSASKVAEYVSKKLTIEVTENMVKNIWNKKTKIYEIDINSDFPFTFQNYLDDIIENPKYFNIFEST